MTLMNQEPWNRDLPESFYLTAENRFSSYTPDQNQGWILKHGKGNPPALVIQSNPAKNYRFYKIFPRFSEGNTTACNPAEFVSRPTLEDFLVNLVEYSYSPLEGILVSTVNWVPDPDLVCGVVRIHNKTNQSRVIRLDLVGQLILPKSGNRLASTNYQGREILSGQLGDEFPVLFMSGNSSPGKGPLPNLTSELILAADQAEELTWTAVLGHSADQSLSLLNKVFQLDWGGEISRLKIKAGSNLQIHTGDPEWDFAFALSQKQAAGYLISHYPQQRPPAGLNHPLSPFQALYLLDVLTPVEPITARRILESVVEGIKEDGSTFDQNCTALSEISALPLAAELVWQAHQVGVDSEGIKILLDNVKRSLDYWFLVNNDRDQDGIPELAHPCQLNLTDTRPLKSHPELALPGHSPKLESPGLGALLYNDLTRLESLKKLYYQDKYQNTGQTKREKLKDFLKNSWNSEKSCFLNRDRDSHMTSPGKLILKNPENGFLILRENISQPSRIGFLFQRKSESELKPGVSFTLHGYDYSGKYRVEQKKKHQIQWIKKQGWASSDTVYSKVDYIFVEELPEDVQLTLFCPSTMEEDISLLLPLWAQVLDPGEADHLITNTIFNKNRYLSSYGIRTIPDPDYAAVQIPWNVLLGQGLLANNKRHQAGELFSRLMNAILININDSGCFFGSYDAKTGQGQGPPNALEGLVPTGYFLKAAGVQIINDRELTIEGIYPFPWPISLHYRGLVIYRDPEETRIDIPGEKSKIYHGSEKQHIRLI